MNQLRAKLQQIAKDKIIKSQRKPKNNTVKKSKSNAKSKNCNRKTKKTDDNARTNNREVFFPEVPIGYFGYVRPREARLATQKEQQLTKDFLEDLEKLKQEKENIQKMKITCINKTK